MSESRLQIRLLGPLEVLREGRPCVLPQSRKTRALLAYLVATGRQHLRQHLCSLLWEGPADPRAALRWSLTKLREITDDAETKRLRATQELIGFEPEDTEVDLRRLRRRVGPDVRKAPLQALAVAAGMFRGEFLEGLDLPECPTFDAWLKAERESAGRLRDSILAALADRHGDTPETALGYARQRVVVQPANEAAHAQVMRILGAMGRLQQVQAQYEACRRILAREAGARPSPDLEALRRRFAPARLRAAPLQSNPGESREPALHPPLIGRHHERAVLDGLLTSARASRSDVLVVTGEAGVGKTRLLTEFRTKVEARKGRVVTGRAFELEMGRPYGPWIDALRHVAVDEIPDHLHHDLAPLLPELGASSSETVDRNRMFEAILALLHHLAQNAVLVVLLDDLHWFDEASITLFHFLARHGRGGHLLFAAAARTAELDDNAAASRLLGALSREQRLRRLDLRPLNAAQTAELIRSFDRRLDAGRVFRDSGGNPLFAIEIAHALDRKADRRSDRLSELISDRLARLSPSARDVAAWAAVWGHDFDLHLLARATSLSTVELLHAVEELERRDVVEAVGPDRYDFRHDLVRRAAYQAISEPRRRLIHGSIARALSSMKGGMSYAAETAHHAALCGDFELAARACLDAGRHALKVFAFEQVAALVRRGCGYLEQLPAEIRTPLHLDLMELWVNPQMRPHHPRRDAAADKGSSAELEEQLWRLIEAARAAGLPAEVRKGFYLLSKIHYWRQDAPRALATTLDAEKVGRTADDVTLLRSVADTARCLAMLGRDMPRAERLSQEAAQLAESIGEPSFEAKLAMGLVRHHAGDLDGAVADYEAASRLAWRDPDPWWEFFCLSRLPMVELERGRPAEALERCRAVEPLVRKMNEGGEEALVAALQALACRALGEQAGTAGLDAAVVRLRSVDSKWTLPYVQILAAQQDIEAGRKRAAHDRLMEALEAAEAVGHCSEATIARAMLARLARDAGKDTEAERHLAGVQAGLTRPEVLSARALEAVQQVLNPSAFQDAISTPSQTPASTPLP